MLAPPRPKPSARVMAATTTMVFSRIRVFSLPAVMRLRDTRVEIPMTIAAAGTIAAEAPPMATTATSQSGSV